jgi:uncharacterized membrane protein
MRKKIENDKNVIYAMLLGSICIKVFLLFFCVLEDFFLSLTKGKYEDRKKKKLKKFNRMEENSKRQEDVFFLGLTTQFIHQRIVNLLAFLYSWKNITKPRLNGN